ncbi:MAG TPA: HepT-like ribonuclease domain-containing protein [Opitutaceae bacterium]|nr:HepT-like ribonuclease domain-containing protein [Opitutaceae bacterium]
MQSTVAEIPRIVGLRNRLIHGYDTVDDQIIWDLVQTKLPPLTQILGELLRR